MSAGSPTELGCRRPTPMRRIAPPPLQNIDAINDEVNGSDELSEWRRELYKAVRPRSRCQAMPCTLLPDLMMSDERGVADAARLLSLGVTHILNLAKGDTAARGEEYASCGIAYLECEAFDRPDYDVLGRHFDESFEFYRKARASPSSRLVVHCLGGVNRSGLVATALYMWATKVTLLDAATEVNRARGSYLWNASFRDQLVRWAAAEGLLGEVPSAESPCISLPAKLCLPFSKI